MWNWLQKYGLIIASVFSLALVGFAIFSYSSLTRKQFKRHDAIQEEKYQAQQKKEKQAEALKLAMFNDPTKYTDSSVVKSQSFKHFRLVSAVQPVKVYSKDNKFVNKNPDAFKLVKFEILKNGAYKYIDNAGNWTLGLGASMGLRDYTLAELHHMFPKLSSKNTASVQAVNLLKSEKVTNQTGPIVQAKAVYDGKLKRDNKNYVEIENQSTITVSDVFTGADGRTYFVIPGNFYMEAQRNFISQ